MKPESEIDMHYERSRKEDCECPLYNHNVKCQLIENTRSKVKIKVIVIGAIEQIAKATDFCTKYIRKYRRKWLWIM